MQSYRRAGVLVTGLLTLALGAGLASGLAAQPVAQAGGADQAAEIARLKEEVERLKGMVPDQSHVMKDVAYHFSNLWFAAHAQNWPLARFYLDETRSHLRWAVRVRPIRRTSAGDLDLRPILQAIDGALLAPLQKTIDDHDATAFAKGYRDSLDGCYSCHRASEKPYLHPHVPDAPEGRIIDFSPGKTEP